MKIFALVEISGIRHMVDDREQAMYLRGESEARGTRLVLCRVLEDIIDDDRFAAITSLVSQGGPGTSTDFGAMIMSALDDLKAAVTKNTSVVDSAVTLLQGVADKLAAANVNNDPAIAALTSEISAEADKLGAAVAANTPAAPPA